MLPRYMDAMSPHTKSLCSTNSSGPGLSPQTIRPPSRIAAVPEPGIPSASIGKQRGSARGVRGRLGREHAFDAPLAEARRVLREPLRQVVAHERRGDRAAGRDAEPAADDRRAQQRHPVARHLPPHLEHGRRLILAAWPRNASRSSIVSRISLMPNRPMTATRKLTPRSSGSKPNVMRNWPETVSMPTAASSSPSAIEMMRLVLGLACRGRRTSRT